MGEAVVTAIAKAGGTASFFQADVTNSAQVKALIDAAVARHGKINVMVNNAAWTHRNQPALDVSEDDFDKCYAINVKSIYLSTIHAVPHFKANGGGSFETGLSAEFAGGPMDEVRLAKFRSSIPLGRFSTALGMANAALYLASDEADFISGVCSELDGTVCLRE